MFKKIVAWVIIIIFNIVIWSNGLQGFISLVSFLHKVNLNPDQEMAFLLTLSTVWGYILIRASRFVIGSIKDFCE